MRVFLSWSGDLSHKLAESFFQWLPLVAQGTEPYMSAHSIEKGARWSAHLGTELEQSRFGVVFLTPDNLASPWLHFEAGAIVKSVDEARLAPLLFGLRPPEVQAPLSQFQVTVFEKQDMMKLLSSINTAEGSQLIPEQRLAHLFDRLWPDLKRAVDEILARPAPAGISKPRDVNALLEEILILVREHAMLLSNPGRLLGQSLESFVGQVIEAQFASEINLNTRERGTVLALLGRWNALNVSLIEHLKAQKSSLAAETLWRDLVEFERYVEQARDAMNKARQGVGRKLAAGSWEAAGGL